MFGVDKFKVNFSSLVSRLNLENEITSKLVSGTPYNFNLDKTTKDSLQVNLEFAPRIDLVINGGAEFIDAQITGGAHDGNKTPGVSEKTFNLKTWLQNKNTTHSLSSKWIGEQFLTTDFNKRSNPSSIVTKYSTITLTTKLKIGILVLELRI